MQPGKIDQRKEKNRAYFPFLKNKPELARNFRAILRQLNAESLEKELFEDCEDRLKPPNLCYQFPDEAAILREFEKLNAHYGFFSSLDTKLSARLLKLFRACKLIADYIECNNGPENDLAFLHAYKIAVITEGTEPFKLLKRLMASQESNKPLHDLLIQDFPSNTPPLQDMKGWRAFIEKYSQKGLEIFQIASEIEAITEGKAPGDMPEATRIASRISYPRYEENPELALICRKYRVREKHFNRCLELEKTAKSRDRLPEVLVDGKEAGYPGYFIVKLPFNDPRKYVLGHITNCCQSIGGHSEACVVDIATLETSGVYVLLKGKGSYPPMLDKAIDYRHFSIVGQGYAWLSKNHNLVLDSWENLRPETDDAVITALMPILGKQLTSQDGEHENLYALIIGTGGKTPEALKQLPEIHPEVMAAGFQYLDSKKQRLLYLNKTRYENILSPLYAQWNALALKPEISGEAFFSFEQYGLLRRDLVREMIRYFLDDRFFGIFLEYQDLHKNHWRNLNFEHFFETAKILDARGLLSARSFRFILNKSMGLCSGKLGEILQFLDKNKLLCEDTLALINEASDIGDKRFLHFLTDCHKGLISLTQENLLNFENCSLFFRCAIHQKNTGNVAAILTFLRKSNLINPANSNKITRLFDRTASGTNVPLVLESLEYLFGQKLLTDAHFMRLLQLEQGINMAYAAELLLILETVQMPVDACFDEILKTPNLFDVLTSFKKYLFLLNSENYRFFLNKDRRAALDRFNGSARCGRPFKREEMFSLSREIPKNNDAILALMILHDKDNDTLREQNPAAVWRIHTLLHKMPCAILKDWKDTKTLFCKLLSRESWLQSLELLAAINPLYITRTLLENQHFPSIVKGMGILHLTQGLNEKRMNELLQEGEKAEYYAEALLFVERLPPEIHQKYKEFLLAHPEYTEKMIQAATILKSDFASLNICFHLMDKADCIAEGLMHIQSRLSAEKYQALIACPWIADLGILFQKQHCYFLDEILTLNPCSHASLQLCLRHRESPEIIAQGLIALNHHLSAKQYADLLASPHAAELALEFPSAMETSPHLRNTLFQPNPFEQKIDAQIEKIRKEGGFQAGSLFLWKDKTSCYPGKWMVLEMLKACINRRISKEAFQLVLNLNPQYNNGWHSETAELVNAGLQLLDNPAAGMFFGNTQR